MPRVQVRHTVTLYGVTYHPHSDGVEMPIHHADALGFSKDEYLGKPKKEPKKKAEQPEPEDDSDLPEGLFKRDALKADERFNSKAKVRENAEQLTELDGIGNARAEEIRKAVE